MGFFYAFVTGFLIGAVLGVVYNQIARVGMAPDHLRSGEARLRNFGFIFAPGSGRSGT